MTFLVPAACALLLFVFFVLLAHPVLSRRPQPAAHAAAHAHLELQHQKELVYAAIKELELDRAVGKIGDGDYEAQRRELEETAVGLLRTLEQGEGHDDRAAVEAQIDEDVATLIAGREASGASDAGARFCGSCGAGRAAEHRFCPQCGAGFSA